MSFTVREERDDEAAHLFVQGALVADESHGLFDQVVRLIDGGYEIHLHLEEVEFIGLAAVRSLRTAAVRAESAGVAVKLYGGSAVYRVADLVGPDQWSPLPAVSFEEDSLPV